MDHNWPADYEEHVFGPWQAKNKKEQYRVCIHPECKHMEERIAPLA